MSPDYPGAAPRQGGGTPLVKESLVTDLNTPGMYRGAVSSARPAAVAIYADEDLRP